MMKLKLFILLVFVTTQVVSQIDFEPGYYIDNANQRINCLIKNYDWKNNPTSIICKTNEDLNEREIGVDEIRKFEITGKSIFVRALVDIDRSSSRIDQLSSVRSVTLLKEKLFLRQLINGSSSLYSYEDGNIVRFFYKIEDGPIKSLIYKKYLNRSNRVAENNQYKQQLLNDLKGNSNEVPEVGYKKKDLKDFIKRLNKQKKSSFSDVEFKQSKKQFLHFSLVAGANYRSLMFEQRNTSFPVVDFENNFGFGFGAELEVVLPFNNNKWAVILEPTLYKYKAETIVPSNGVNDNANASFNTFELVLGLRHYIFLSESLKAFFNVMVDYAFIPSTEIVLGANRPNVTIGDTLGPGLGFGFDLYDRIGLEIRYQYFGDIVSTTINNTKANFGGLSLICNYKIF